MHARVQFHFRSVLFLWHQITTKVVSGHFSYGAGLDCTQSVETHQVPRERTLSDGGEEKLNLNRRKLPTEQRQSNDNMNNNNNNYGNQEI